MARTTARTIVRVKSFIFIIPLLIPALLVPHVTPSAGVNPGIFENFLQFFFTEDIPSQLRMSRFVVVEMSHHFSLLEIHLHFNRPVLKGSYVL